MNRIFKHNCSCISRALTLVFVWVVGAYPDLALAKTYQSGDVILELTCQNKGSVSLGHDFKAGLGVGMLEKKWVTGRLNISVAHELYSDQAVKESKRRYDFKLRAEGEIRPTISGRAWVTSSVTIPDTMVLVLTEVGGTTLNLFLNNEGVCLH